MIVTALMAALAATNRWMSWAHGFVYAHADDENAYLVIARASPHLPAGRIADQHAQRWPLHWLIGAVADLTGWQLELLYRYAAIALAIAVCLMLAAVLIRLGASVATGAVCLAAFACNPYALRYYALAPGYLDDLVFDLALGVLLLGLLARRLPLVLGGLVLGLLARQTMLPVASVVALWIGLSPAWRSGGVRARLSRAGAALVVAIAVYLVVTRVASGFSEAGAPFGRLTILDTVEQLPGSAHDLLNHFAHVVNGLLAVAALLAATLLSTRFRDLSWSFWGPLAIGLVIVLQAAALNPDPVFNDYNSTNEPRLVAPALVAFAVALAGARSGAARSRVRPLGDSPVVVTLALALLAIGSLHHTYTSISTGGKGVTLALELAVALALFVLVLRWDRSGRAGGPHDAVAVRSGA
ncbi:MAG: hypothetical protein JWQ48_1115 [Conexibacter sp.]|nr:hypothetical protein [Conexibacter sp.]